MITKLEIPLCPYDSCRLMSVNLYSFVENPFTDKAYFNYDKFKDVVYKAQRLMDDVVDLEEEKINLILNKIENDPEPEEIKAVEKNLWFKIKQKLLDGRRTGLSAIGLADCFASLSISYASESSITLAEEIYKQFAISAYKSSIDMAKERGAFPIWDLRKESNNPFLNRILNIGQLDKLQEPMYQIDVDYLKYGRRNIALLTVPPSGSISMFGNRTGISSGIEPVYQLYYKRRYKILENTEEKKAYDFIDANGDKWKEYVVLHPKFKYYIENIYWRSSETEKPRHIADFIKSATSNYEEKIGEKYGLISIKLSDRIIQESLYHKSTAYEIDPLQRVKLQATIQKYLDHSISSTINLPKDTTEETVSNLYMEAWKQGCKGLTIYVDECRTGVLVSADNKKDTEFKQHNAPKRPKELQAEFHKIKVKSKDYGVFIGLLDNKPYEIFAVSEPTTDTKFIKGIIKKSDKGKYEFNSETYHVINLVNCNETAEERTFTLMLSGLLRHGAHPKFIIDWINKAELEITSFGTSISRILKKYIQNNEATKELCPECGSVLIYKDGCKECLCGWAKCN